MYFVLKGVVEATVTQLSSLDMEYLSDSSRLQSHLSGTNMNAIRVRSTSLDKDRLERDKSEDREKRSAGFRRLGSQSRLTRTYSVAEAVGSADVDSMPVGLYSDGSLFGQVTFSTLQ
jgi:hypothetical protein